MWGPLTRRLRRGIQRCERLRGLPLPSGVLRSQKPCPARTQRLDRNARGHARWLRRWAVWQQPGTTGDPALGPQGLLVVRGAGQWASRARDNEASLPTRRRQGYCAQKGGGEGARPISLLRGSDEETKHVFVCRGRLGGGFAGTRGLFTPEGMLRAGGRPWPCFPAATQYLCMADLYTHKREMRIQHCQWVERAASSEEQGWRLGTLAEKDCQ